LNAFGINTIYEPSRVIGMRTAASATTCAAARAPMFNAFGARATPGRFHMVNSLAEFKSKFGWSEDFLTYELCGLAHIFFNVIGARPLIVHSALDAENDAHARDLAGKFELRQRFGRAKATTITEQIGGADVPVTGVDRDAVQVFLTNPEGEPVGAALVRGRDYALGQNDAGECFIRPVMGGAVFPLNPAPTDPEAVTVHIAYRAANPDGVTALDVVTALSHTRMIYPVIREVPRLLLAPGWSRSAGVSDALVAYSTKINSVFDANSIVDIDSRADGARDVESAMDFKDRNGQTDPTQKPCWPCLRLDETHVVHYSSVIAGLINGMEANSGAPSRTESNETLPGMGMCLEDGTPVALDMDEANRLRGYGITTGFFWNGANVVWGAYSGAVPSTTQPEDSFWNVNRFLRWYAAHLVLTYFQVVDQNISRRLVDMILGEENDYLAWMAARNWCPIGSIEFPADLNNDAELASGHLWFRTKPSAYLPAQQINFLIELDLQPMFDELRGGSANA